MTGRSESSLPSHEMIRHKFNYDPNSGRLTRAVTSGSAVAGAVAGGPGKNGYVYVSCGNRHFLAHRIIWCWMTGEWPSKCIDHINGDPLDNRWENLRLATHSQNLCNSRVRSDNKVGVKGVCKSGKRYRATITFGGKTRHIGYFSTLEEASKARADYANQYHCEFARAS